MKYIHKKHQVSVRDKKDLRSLVEQEVARSQGWWGKYTVYDTGLVLLMYFLLIL